MDEGQEATRGTRPRSHGVCLCFHVRRKEQEYGPRTTRRGALKDDLVGVGEREEGRGTMCEAMYTLQGVEG